MDKTELFLKFQSIKCSKRFLFSPSSPHPYFEMDLCDFGRDASSSTSFVDVFIGRQQMVLLNAH